MSLAQLRAAIEVVGFGFEALGVIVIALGSLVAIGRFFAQGLANLPARYRPLRQELGGAIVLGLEFLVAGDIIRTVATSPTFEDLGTLAIIIVLRTFLSFSLELEITGRFPWQRDTSGGDRGL